jgi:hypothetical protein
MLKSFDRRFWWVQNMFLALGSIVALALPVLLGSIPLWLAVGLHEGSTLLVALNSLRLLHWDQPEPPAATGIQEGSLQSAGATAAASDSSRDGKLPLLTVAAQAA